MFQSLGFLVHTIQADAQVPGQVQFDQPVVADDLQRNLLASGGELHAVVGRVVHQLQPRQFLDHVGRGGGGHVQARRDSVRRHRLAGLAEFVDHLEVIFYCLS